MPEQNTVLATLGMKALAKWFRQLVRTKLAATKTFVEAASELVKHERDYARAIKSQKRTGRRRRR